MTLRIEGDVRDVGQDAETDLTVICPFYNEQQILTDAISTLRRHLDDLGRREGITWELLVVNDGSTDDSWETAKRAAAGDERVRVVGYRYNRGRGHALRTGIDQARGAILVTTEIDLSWGDDIVERLWREMRDWPDTDLVIASPHLPNGGYKNVPPRRVWVSKFGNKVIRACMSNTATMNTGMTRAYRRAAIRNLPLEEDKKEFHLEVVLKAQALGYRFREIPAILEWKDYKHQGQRVQRKSSSKVNKLIVSHSLFSLFANPIRYVWTAGMACIGLSLGFLVAGLVRLLYTEQVSVYMAIISLGFAGLSILLFTFGVLAQQNNMIQRELWQMKRDALANRSSGEPASPALTRSATADGDESRHREVEFHG